MKDLHIHTIFSFDGKAKIESYINFAKQNFFDTIGFAEHDEIIDSMTLFKNYLNTISKNDKKTNVNILSGIELDIKNISNLSSFIYNSLDFILCSYHLICKTPTEYYINFYNLLLDKKIFSLFDVLAHIDFPLRYNLFANSFFDQFSKDSFQYIEKILLLLINNNKSLEINSGIFFRDYKDVATKFWQKVIEIYKKNKGYLFTFGSDSHNLDDFILSISHRKEILNLLGLDESDFMSYKKHKVF